MSHQFSILVSGRLGLCEYFVCTWPLTNWGDLAANSDFNPCAEGDPTNACAQFLEGSICVDRNSKYECVCSDMHQRFFGKCIPASDCKLSQQESLQFSLC